MSWLKFSELIICLEREAHDLSGGEKQPCSFSESIEFLS